MPTIGKPAPTFDLPAVIDGEITNVKLSDYAGKWVVLFFYPMDFTFVCPTEIIAFSDRIGEFAALNTAVMAASVDTVMCHLAWTKQARSEGGLGNMNIPLIGDVTKSLSKDYGVLIEDGEDAGVAFRGLFIIDPEGILQQITINNLPVGRSVDETLRLIQAFQFTAEHGEVCPANWTPGEATIIPDPKGSKSFFASGATEGAGESKADGVSITELDTTASLEAFTANGTSIIKYWAPWCGNCKKLSPFFNKLVADNAAVNFGSLNVADNQETAVAGGVTKLPYFAFYKDGEKIGQYSGSKRADLAAKVAEVVA